MARESKNDLPANQGKGSKPPESRTLKYRLLSRLPPNRKAAAFHLLILLGVGFISSWILSPDLFSTKQTYGFDASSLGKISQKVIKANRDYDIPDEETTERKRQEARDAVLPVYDEDLSVSQAALDRVRKAFSLMRSGIDRVEAQVRQSETARQAELNRRKALEASKAPTDSAAHEEEGDTAAALKPSTPPPDREALYREMFVSLRDEWRQTIEIQIDDEHFEALVEDHFSQESQEVIQDLIRVAYAQGVVENRETLAILAKQGITVRKGDGPTLLREAFVRDVSAIREFREIPQEALRWMGELRQDLSDKPTALRQALLHIATRQVRINVSYNAPETERRRRQSSESVKPVVIQLKKGEKIIGDGEKIEPKHIFIFTSINQQSDSHDLANAHVGAAFISMLLIVAVQWFARRSLRRYRLMTLRDALFVTSTLVLMLLVVRLTLFIGDSMQDRFTQIGPEPFYYLAPFAAGAMLIRFILSAEASLVFTVVFAGLAGIASGNSLPISIYAIVGSFVAANQVARANERLALFKAGAWTGVANVLVVLCLSLISTKMGASETAVAALCAFISGIFLVPMLVMGLTPPAESLFGYTTDIKLLELANLNHPALKELILQAPGTYHHSIIIGSLVEAAAEAIGANPLLARVCAYYHDIGKGKNPLYFAENQRGDNKHNKLAPQMSALIIKRHVTDGMELARQYKLPAPVAAAIPEHHGTRLISFFYSKAVAEQEGKSDPQPIEQSLYCYPGPKPQSRETALVMIADVVEASSRAMQNPTPSKLQALIQTVINGVFSDGQFDECDLTLRDLNEIGKSFFQVLGGIYHSRPEYPAQALSGGRTNHSEVRDLKELKAKEELSREEAVPAVASPPEETSEKKADGKQSETTAKLEPKINWGD